MTKEVNLLCCAVNAAWQCVDCKALECSACSTIKEIKGSPARLGSLGHFTTCPNKEDFYLIGSKES